MSDSFAPILASVLSIALAAPAFAQQGFFPPPVNATGITALAGDCTASGGGSVAITCMKTGGAPFASSATTDATNAANISSGTLNLNRLPSGSTFLAGSLTAAGSNAANMNTTSDQAIALTGPSSGSWIVVRAIVTNCSAASNAAAGAFYTLPTKYGGVELGAASFQYPPGGGAEARLVMQSQSNGYYSVVYSTSSATIYFSLTTAQGATDSCDIYVYGQKL